MFSLLAANKFFSEDLLIVVMTIILSLVIMYFVIKLAVKNGTKEAYRDISNIDINDKTDYKIKSKIYHSQSNNDLWLIIMDSVTSYIKQFIKIQKAP